MTKSLLKPLCFFGFFIVVICCALKYHAAEIFLIGGCVSFEMAVVLGSVAVNACQDLATLPFHMLRKQT
jgi:hypothetical protein